jgi:hypothetical protein
MKMLDPQTIAGLLGVLLLGIGAGGVVETWPETGGLWAGLAVIGACLYAAVMRGSRPPPAEE